MMKPSKAKIRWNEHIKQDKKIKNKKRKRKMHHQQRKSTMIGINQHLSVITLNVRNSSKKVFVELKKSKNGKQYFMYQDPQNKPG